MCPARACRYICRNSPDEMPRGLREAWLMKSSQEPDRQPGNGGHYERAYQERNHVAHDRLHSLVRVDAANAAGRVLADAERRREQADTHRENDHHRVMDIVDADLPRDRK